MKNKKKKKVKRPLLAEGNQTKEQIESSHYDPNGCWTGVPDNPLTIPEQDADDL